MVLRRGSAREPEKSERWDSAPYTAAITETESGVYTLRYAAGVAGDLKKIRAYERKRILGAIEKQLRHQPSLETRNRKTISGLEPPWDHREPIWELRVGQYRIFYDVDELDQVVIVRAVRHKPPHQRTEDIL